MLNFIPSAIVIWKNNIKSLLEYRSSLFLQFFGMFINNAIYLTFWEIFFNRFDSIAGQGMDQLLILFAFVNCGFGITSFFFGNSKQLAVKIIGGELDYYILRPKPILPHILITRMSQAALADIVFGLICLAFSRPDPKMIVLFFFCLIFVVISMIGFDLITNSLTFWFGDVSFMSRTATQAAITFSLYPNTLFSNFTKLLLLTLIPAAFFSSLPMRLMQDLRLEDTLLFIFGSLALLFIGRTLFYRGLKRYECNNFFTINT